MRNRTQKHHYTIFAPDDYYFCGRTLCLHHDDSRLSMKISLRFRTKRKLFNKIWTLPKPLEVYYCFDKGDKYRAQEFTFINRN